MSDEVIKTGDCFEVALHVAMEHPGSKIVHGLPIGRGPLNGGKRYWHAWVETTLAGIPWVLDLANDRGISLPKSVYYNIGQQEGFTWEFTLAQARREVDKRMHYGPWVDDYEEMEEV